MILLRRVVGDSMRPALRPGQLVVLAGSRRLEVGDIVMISHGGLEKIKRISKIDGEKIYLLGDNLSQSIDSRSFGWLPTTSVRGRVVANKLFRKLS